MPRDMHPRGTRSGTHPEIQSSGKYVPRKATANPSYPHEPPPQFNHAPSWRAYVIVSPVAGYVRLCSIAR